MSTQPKNSWVTVSYKTPAKKNPKHKPQRPKKKSQSTDCASYDDEEKVVKDKKRQIMHVVKRKLF